MSLINALAHVLANTVAVHHKTQLVDVRGNVPHICKLALDSAQDAAPMVQRSAQGLLKNLREQGVNVEQEAARVDASGRVAQAPAATQPAAIGDSALGAVKAPPSAVDWKRFEDAAIEVIGPMGARMVRDARNKFPDATPREVKPHLQKFLDGEMIRQIYARYPGS